MSRVLLLCSAFVLAACGEGFLIPAVQPAPDPGQTRPEARPPNVTAPPPPANARTAEEFDTTTASERAEAAAAPVSTGERSLGMTIASLGDVTEPGFWLKTPLVSAATPGRVVYQGKSSQVDLIPIDGPATAGSRISLAAMRLIGAPLTELPEIQVFSDG